MITCCLTIYYRFNGGLGYHQFGLESRSSSAIFIHGFLLLFLIFLVGMSRNKSMITLIKQISLYQYNLPLVSVGRVVPFVALRTLGNSDCVAIAPQVGVILVSRLLYVLVWFHLWSGHTG